MPCTDFFQDDITWQLEDDVWDEEEKGDDGVTLSHAQLQTDLHSCDTGYGNVGSVALDKMDKLEHKGMLAAVSSSTHIKLTA